MKQCTQSPATTGLVVTYSKSSPNTSSFVFRNSILCRLFLQPLYMHYTLSLSQTICFCIYTHIIHRVHRYTYAHAPTNTRARVYNNFVRHLIFFGTPLCVPAYVRIVLACVCCVALFAFQLHAYVFSVSMLIPYALFTSQFDS